MSEPGNDWEYRKLTELNGVRIHANGKGDRMIVDAQGGSIHVKGSTILYTTDADAAKEKRRASYDNSTSTLPYVGRATGEYDDPKLAKEIREAVRLVTSDKKFDVGESTYVTGFIDKAATRDRQR